MRRETLDRHACLRDAFATLGGTIQAAEMRRMNYAVDGDRRPHAEVAHEFLERSGLAGTPTGELGGAIGG